MGILAYFSSQPVQQSKVATSSRRTGIPSCRLCHSSVQSRVNSRWDITLRDPMSDLRPVIGAHSRGTLSSSG